MASPLTNKPSFQIRQEISQSVGTNNLRDFELWAFKVSPVKYNRDLLRLWNLHHASDLHVSENIGEGFSEIIKYWKE